MKHDILKLAKIAKNKSRIIIGLMSGTSLDGLDVARCQFSGAGTQTKVKVLNFETVPYDEGFKNEIRRVFAKQQIDFQHLTLLNAIVAERHADIVLACLKKWNLPPGEIDLLASHGQTVFHAPKILHGLENYPNATLQIGDGDHLARRTNILTISDFRQKHVAAGGEGAPLALYGDYFLFSKKGESRVLLNMGGIANFTCLFADLDPQKCFATDSGPANTLLDYFARKNFGVPFDQDALLAKAGRIDERLLEILKANPYFEKPFPKTTGPELFSPAFLENAIAQLPKGSPNPFDVMATLTQFTVETIAEALAKIFGKNEKPKVFASGGGAHNPLIMSGLRSALPNFKFLPMEKLGVSGDAKEAVLFACLANELVAGEQNPGMMLGGLPLVSMGKVSLPM